jgi:hypothetical protein|tara:strand:+ start:138 stop:335 length:198 start_codon:yes stop_codon:yes gene_type:complete
MADYNTITKVIINDVSPAASSVAGSLAKEINDYIQTLDSTNNAIVDIQAVMLDRTRVAYIIVSTG